MNSTLSFSIPTGDVKKVKSIINNTQLQYDIYDKNRCTKGKALIKLLELGQERLIEVLEAKAEKIRMQKQKLTTRVEEVVKE